MKTTHIIAGAALVVVGWLWFQSRAPKQLSPQQRIATGGTGSAHSIRSNAGVRLVAIAGGVGAGAGRPLDTSERIKTTGSATPPRGRKR